LQQISEMHLASSLKSLVYMALFDFLFGSNEHSCFDAEDYRSVAEDRRHYAQGSSNWTDREDWDCGEPSDDGMSGFDIYEDNDF
jgi:hypothetical protein